MRGNRRAVVWGATTSACLLTIAALVGRPSDLVVWIRDVTPSLSNATDHVFNQSLPGWVDRLHSGDAFAQGQLHTWVGLAPAIAVGGAIGLWWWRRRQPIDPLELGLVLLLALI